jgi:hypothetical protein
MAEARGGGPSQPPVTVPGPALLVKPPPSAPPRASGLDEHAGLKLSRLIDVNFSSDAVLVRRDVAGRNKHAPPPGPVPPGPGLAPTPGPHPPIGPAFATQRRPRRFDGRLRGPRPRYHHHSSRSTSMRRPATASRKMWRVSSGTMPQACELRTLVSGGSKGARHNDIARENTHICPRRGGSDVFSVDTSVGHHAGCRPTLRLLTGATSQHATVRPWPRARQGALCCKRRWRTVASSRTCHAARRRSRSRLRTNCRARCSECKPPNPSCTWSCDRRGSRTRSRPDKSGD